MAKNRNETKKIELVETHNIALAIARVKTHPSTPEQAWRRALYHALLMNYPSFELAKKIREALELP